MPGVAQRKVVYREDLLKLAYNLCTLMFTARSERYHHLASDEDEETNDEESSLEIRQFSSWSHRFSKVQKTTGSSFL